MTTEIPLLPFPRPQVPLIDADIDLMDIRRLADWCEKGAKEYARANVARATAALQYENAALRVGMGALRRALSRILENEASDYKSAEEFGGYVLDDELREEARAALGRAEDD